MAGVGSVTVSLRKSMTFIITSCAVSYRTMALPVQAGQVNNNTA
jgi:hypothetical protein